MRNIHKLRELTVDRVLLEEELIDEDQALECQTEHESSGDRRSEIIVRLASVTEWDIAKALVKHLHVPFIRSASYTISRDVLKLIPATLLHQHRIVPLDVFDRTLLLASTGDIDADVIEEIERETSLEVALFVSLPTEITHCLEEYFPLENVSKEVAARLDQLFGDE